jgi:hypothetical protein
VKIHLAISLIPSARDDKSLCRAMSRIAEPFVKAMRTPPDLLDPAFGLESECQMPRNPSGREGLVKPTGRISQLVFFYAVLFSADLLFCGWLTAASVALLVALLNALAKKWIWNRFLLFGENSLESLFFGAILGLGLFSLVWTGVALFVTGSLRLVLTILVLLLLLVLPAKRKKTVPLGEERVFTTGHALVLLLILLLITSFPFLNLGKETPAGSAYRAYFADYLKHFAVTNALTYRTVPPENPFFMGSRLHYYWMPYAVPSTLLTVNHDVEKAVLGFAVTINWLLLSALFMLIRSSFKTEKGSAFFSYFFTLAPVLFLSFEGIYLVGKKFTTFNPFHFLKLATGYNVDGLTRWWWHTPQIDTLLRTLLYTPQAALSLSFFVVYLFLRRKEGCPVFLPPFLLCASLFCNILVGSAFIIFYGFDLLYFAFRQGRGQGQGKLFLSRLVYSAAFLAACLGLLFGFGILQKVGSKFSLLHLPLAALPPYLLLNLGMLLILGSLGALLTWKKEPYLPAGLVIGGIICTLQIEGFPSDISLKMSLVLAVLLTLAAVGLFTHLQSKRLFWLSGILLVLCLPGGFSALIDEFNSADIHNKQFTFYLPKEEKLLLRWARQSLPADAVVQDYPPARQFDSSLIPTFLARQTYVGDSINGRLFFTDAAAYQARIDQLKRIFASLPASQNELKEAGITHLFWGLAEEQTFGYVPKLKIVKRLQSTYLFEIQ